MQTSEFDPSVALALPRLLALAADEEACHEISKILPEPGVRLLAVEGDNYLFSLQTKVREEHACYRYFVFGRLLEVRRMGWFSNQYSMVAFPRDLAANRYKIETLFSEIVVSTDDGMGWFAPARWEDLSPEQHTMAMPKFIEDDVRYVSM